MLLITFPTSKIRLIENQLWYFFSFLVNGSPEMAHHQNKTKVDCTMEKSRYAAVWDKLSSWIFAHSWPAGARISPEISRYPKTNHSETTLQQNFPPSLVSILIINIISILIYHLISTHLSTDGYWSCQLYFILLTTSNLFCHQNEW